MVIAAGNTFLSPSPTSPLTLTFTATDWRQAQTVTVTARDDRNDVAESLWVSHTASTMSGDGYDGVSAPLPVSVAGETAIKLDGTPVTRRTYAIEGRRWRWRSRTMWGTRSWWTSRAGAEADDDDLADRLRVGRRARGGRRLQPGPGRVAHGGGHRRRSRRAVAGSSYLPAGAGGAAACGGQPTVAAAALRRECLEAGRAAGGRARRDGLRRRCEVALARRAGVRGRSADEGRGLG